MLLPRRRGNAHVGRPQRRSAKPKDTRKIDNNGTRSLNVQGLTENKMYGDEVRVRVDEMW